MNYFFKLLLAILWGIEAVFLLIIGITVLLLENILMIGGYKRGSNKVIRWIDKFVEKEVERGRYIWTG